MTGKPRRRRIPRLDFRILSHRELRRRVFARDAFTCKECGWRPPMTKAERVAYDGRLTIGTWKRWLHVDHVLPLVAGGALKDEDNAQTLCSSCNSRKAGRVT